MTLPPFLRQPTTVAGIAILAGAAAGVGAYFASAHSFIYAQAVGGAVAGAILIALQDNSGDRSNVEKLVSDAIIAVATRRLTPEIVADVKQVFAAQVSSPAAVSVVVQSPVAPPPAQSPSSPVTWHTS